MTGETGQVTDLAAADTEGANADPEAAALRDLAAATQSGAESDQALTIEQRLEAIETANKALEDQATAAEARANDAEQRARAATASVGPEVDRRVGQFVENERRKATLSNLTSLRARAVEGDSSALEEMHRLAVEAMEQPAREAQGSAVQAQAVQDRMYRIFLPRVEALAPSKTDEAGFVQLFQAGRYEDLDAILREAEKAKYATPSDNGAVVTDERQKVAAARSKAGLDEGAGGPGGGSVVSSPAESADLDTLFAIEHKRLQGMRAG